MRNLLTIAIGVALAFILSGCGVMLHDPYNVDYVTKNLDMNKGLVESKKVTVEKDDLYSFIKNPTNFPKNSRTNIKFDIGLISGNISGLFAKQYFKNVSFSDKLDNDSYLHLKVKITDIVYTLDLWNDGSDIDLFVDVEAFSYGKKILSKSYVKNADTGVRYGLIGVSPPYVITNESVHKGLLNLLDTEVKADLVKALKENM